MHELHHSKTKRFIESPFGLNGICKLEEQKESRRLRRARLIAAVERDVAVLIPRTIEEPPDAHRTSSAVCAYRVLVRCALLVHVHVDMIRPHDPYLEERIAAMPLLPADGDLRRKATYQMMIDIAIRSGTSPAGQTMAALMHRFVYAMQALADDHWQALASAATCLSQARNQGFCDLVTFGAARNLRHFLRDTQTTAQ